MSYPTRHAELVVKDLNSIASRAGITVLVGALESCGQGEEFRSVTVEVDPSEWKRLQSKLSTAGWRQFGGESIVYALPQRTFVIAEPQF